MLILIFWIGQVWLSFDFKFDSKTKSLKLIKLVVIKGVLHPGQFLDYLCTFLKNYNTLVVSKVSFL